MGERADAQERSEGPAANDGMQVESGRWKVGILTAHICDDVDFDIQRGKGAGEFVSVIPHSSLHSGEFASDEAKLHLQKSCERARVVDKVGRLYRTVREIISWALVVCRHLKALMPE